MIPKKLFRFIFLFYFSLIFISCSLQDSKILSSFSLDHQTLRSESEDSDKEPELRFSFQMTSSSPEAVLSEDKVVKVGSQVLIDGSSEQATSYRWNFDVFPVNSNTKIDDPTASSVSFTPDVPGLYLVRLVVRSSDTNSEPIYSAIRATEDNTPPDFRFSLIGARNNGFPQQVRIRLRDIQDDGEVRFVEVDYGDGNQTVFYQREIETIGGNLEHHYLEEGSYEIKVSMIDDKGARATKSTTVNLRKEAKIPVLKYSVNGVSGTAPFTLRVDASSAFDPDNNNPLSFFWGWGDEGAFTFTEDVVSTYTYKKPGIYTVQAFTSDRGAGERFNFFTVYVDDPDNLGTYSTPAGGSPPVLNLVGTGSSFSGQAPLTVNFDASQSFDLEGDSFEVFWMFDGFSFNQFDEGLKVSRTYDNPGRYSVRVGIRDSHGNEYMRYFDVYVYDPLVEEPAGFIARQRSSDPYRIQFNSSTPELYGVPAYYRLWDLGDGNFARYNNSHTYSQDGIYPVTFTAIDIFGKRQSVSKVLTIDGKKHEVSARGEPFYEVVQVGSSANFSGSESSSSVSGALDFLWYLVTGVRRSIEGFNYSYSKRGVYENIMAVTNAHGLSDRSYYHRVVNSGEGPKAKARFSTYIGTAPLTVDFDGSYSKSPGNITDYKWHLGNYDDLDMNFTGAQVSYTYKKPGEINQELYVKDNNGNFDVGFYQVTVLDPNDVSPGNQSPSAVIDSNNIAIDDLTIDMESSLSDSDGQIRYTEWDWGDEIVDVFSYNESSPSHTYESYGSYTITVRVFDNMGAITTASHNIILSKPQNNSQRAESSVPGARGQQQSLKITLPARPNDTDRFEEERQKTGCYKKTDGQIRCYAPQDHIGGI